MNGVVTVKASKNAKIGEAAATYAAQQTCPSACPLRNAGCYAESGNVRYVTQRLNRTRARPLTIAREEARQIDALPGDRPLRVHVVGDCPTDASARLVSAAMERYTQRSGMPAWTYTHAWRDVKRASWGNASVLASCESTADVRKAQRKGYATAIVIDGEGPTDTRIVKCPAQTHSDVTCASCRLCMDAPRLHAGRISIAFQVHGAGKNAARAAIERIGS